MDLRRAWDLQLNIIIADPLPREGADFSIVPTENQWEDSFLTLVVDEFPFAIQYDIYPWPESEDNPMRFEGKVNIFRLVEFRAKQ
ncbi:MAG: hypothetical protein M3P30_10485 [Chloroflexota bacterium]|nr:hypothetical protein [Chloroflexota bacterium]